MLCYGHDHLHFLIYCCYYRRLTREVPLPQGQARLPRSEKGARNQMTNLFLHL